MLLISTAPNVGKGYKLLLAYFISLYYTFVKIIILILPLWTAKYNYHKVKSKMKTNIIKSMLK